MYDCANKKYPKKVNLDTKQITGWMRRAGGGNRD